MELRHLRAFVAVAEELHFTRAARRLHLAQQALSSQIRQLEKNIGTPLFRRTTRFVELTLAGRLLLDRAPDILARVDASWDTVTRIAANGRYDPLRIAYTPTAGNDTFPKLAGEFRDRYPDFKIKAQEAWIREAVAGVLGGAFDVGLVRHPEPAKHLSVQLVRWEELRIVLSAEHPLARGERVDQSQLEEMVFALLPRDYSPGFYDVLMETFEANFAKGRIYEYETFSQAGFYADLHARNEIAARRAFSITLSRPETAPEGFAYVPLDAIPRVGLHMVHRSNRDSPLLLSFLEMVKEVRAAETWVPPAADDADLSASA